MRLRLKAPVALSAALFGAAVAITPASAQQGPFVSSTTGAFLSGLAAAQRLDLESAAWFYSFVLQRDPANTQLAATVFSLWLEVGNIGAAAPIAATLVDIDPGFEMGRLVLATQAIRSGQYQAARDHLDAIVPNDPLGTLTVGLLRAWLHQAVGETDEALALLDGLDEQFPEFTYYESALIADLAGRRDVALFFAEQAFQSSRSIGSTMLYASLLARTGDVAGAERALVDLLDDIPGQPQAERQLAAIRAGDFGGPEVTDIRGGAATVFFDMATAIMMEDGGRTSVPYLQLSLRLWAEGPATAVALGDLLQQLDRHEQAITTFALVAADSPFAREAALGAATSEAILGEVGAAITRLEPLAAAEPTDGRIALVLANMYQSQERWADVVALVTPVIDSVIEPGEDMWRLFYVRGAAFERLGEWDRAEGDFRIALMLEPEQADVLNYLGYAMADRGENAEEALDLIQRALAQRPQAGHIVDSLGWAYYRLGRYDEAVTELERAVELEPRHPEVAEHLGDAYWRAGREFEAVYQWTHALEFDPAPAAAARLAEKIRSGLPDVARP